MTISRSLSATKGARAVLTALLIACIVSTGCSKYGKQITKVNHYPDCYEPIAEMRKSEYGVAKSAAGGAILGGILGAIGGYLATGKAHGAVVGAAAGAAVGGATGHYIGKKAQDEEDAARMASYAAQLDGDITEVDKATAGAKVARMCYERQFALAVSEFKSGHITKDQFYSRYVEAASGMEEAAYILGETNKYSAEVALSYRQAVEAEAERMGVPKQAVRPQKGRATAKGQGEVPKVKPLTKAERLQASAKLKTEEGKQLSKLAERASSMEKSVESLQDEERLLRERLAATHKAAEDLMS